MAWQKGDGIEIISGDYKGCGATITAVYQDGVYAELDGEGFVVWLTYDQFRLWRTF